MDVFKGSESNECFFLQVVLKAKLILKPALLKQKIDKLSLKNSNLRAAYAYRELKRPYGVILKNCRPEINFYR